MTDNQYIHYTPESGNVENGQYCPKTHKLRISFRNNKTYQYNGVPPVVWEGFKSDMSTGSFLSKNIKGFFSYQQV